MALLVILPGILRAEPTIPLTDSRYLLHSWGVEEGLPENSATAVVQTPDGYLWVGTWNGLVRYNGDKFRVFNPENTPTLPHPGIVNVHADRRGRLWVSTLAGLVVKDGPHWRQLGASEGWPGDPVRTFAERPNGDLLLTTFDGHILELAHDRVSQLPPPPGEIGQGYLGTVDDDGRWWVTQNRFIGHWENQQWVTVLTPPPSVARSRVACAPARGGGVWILVNQELFSFRGATLLSQSTLPPLKGGIWSIHEDSRTNLWICSYDSGLYQWTPAQGLSRWTETNGLGSLSTRGMLEDPEANLWIASNGGGLARLTPRRFFTPETDQLITRKVTRAVATARAGGFWIAAYDGGLFRQEPTGTTRVMVPGPNNASAYGLSVLEDRSGRLWYGDEDHCWVRHGQDRFEKAPLPLPDTARVNALFEDSHGRVWIAHRRGAMVCHGNDYRQLGPETGLPPGPITCFGEDHAGGIWVAQPNGVWHWASDRFTPVLAADGQPLAGVLCFKAEPDGAMWMGTRADGLIRWRNGALNRVGLEHGLPEAELRGILADGQGCYWMPSNRGVIRAKWAQLHAAADREITDLEIQLLDQHDGLPSPECSSTQPNAARDPTGQFWFATQKGVATINPALFQPNSRPPPVHIEQLTYRTGSTTPAPGERWPLAAGRHQTLLAPPFLTPLRLPAGAYALELQFAALSFSAPDKVRFQCRLEGYSGHWLDPGKERRASFHRLPPGDYVFRVRAANNDGLWNDTGASLAFSVLPYFWQTAWFRVGAGLFLVLLGGAAASWQARSHVQRALERERAANEIRELAGRLINAQEDERRRIARELHDHFSQSLALLSVELELLGTSAPVPETQKQQQFEQMTARVKELSSDVHRMAHELHPAKLDQLGLESAARSFCRDFSKQSGLRIAFTAEAFPRQIPPEAAVCLYRIIQEALHNVVRHSGAPEAQVELRANPGQLGLIVADSGCGFQVGRAKREGGLGLSSMQERVRLLHGTLNVNSAPGLGTRIEVTLPMAHPTPAA
ncbi:MAG: hypothetical protein KJ072_26380 [Verrucomicrobia bacterium]|nr:hypothetical protein [Verrucomicrobiota bacterium]